MENSFNFIEQLGERLFWDIDLSTLDKKASKRLIIERVFSLGSIEDMKKTTACYGYETTVKVLKDLNYLDPKTLNFVSLIFKTPKSEFKCYTRRWSNLQHWSS